MDWHFFSDFFLVRSRAYHFGLNCMHSCMFMVFYVCVCVSTKGDTLLPDVSFSRSSFVVVSFHSAVMHIIQYFYSVHGYSIILTFWLCARFLPAR